MSTSHNHRRTTVTKVSTNQEGATVTADVPWSRVSKRSTREWWIRARQRFLDLSPEEQAANGGTLALAQPTQQTSKGRNIKRNAYKRAKRLEQARQN